MAETVLLRFGSAEMVPPRFGSAGTVLLRSSWAEMVPPRLPS
jgi:hypothetical protein